MALLYLKIRNPDDVVFEGEIESISSTNKIGKFDILDTHANFISLVENSLIIRRQGREEEIKVVNGVLKAKENKILVYLGVKR